MSELWWTNDLSQAIQWCDDQYYDCLHKKARSSEMFVVQFCGVYYVVNCFELASYLLNARDKYIVYERRNESSKERKMSEKVRPASLFPTRVPLRAHMAS